MIKDSEKPDPMPGTAMIALQTGLTRAIKAGTVPLPVAVTLFENLIDYLAEQGYFEAEGAKFLAALGQGAEPGVKSTLQTGEPEGDKS